VGADQMARGDATGGAAQTSDTAERARLAGLAKGPIEGRIAPPRAATPAPLGARSLFSASLAHTRAPTANDESPDPRRAGGSERTAV
jgi:hypothetical protein